MKSIRAAVSLSVALVLSLATSPTAVAKENYLCGANDHYTLPFSYHRDHVVRRSAMGCELGSDCTITQNFICDHGAWHIETGSIRSACQSWKAQPCASVGGIHRAFRLIELSPAEISTVPVGSEEREVSVTHDGSILVLDAEGNVLVGGSGALQIDALAIGAAAVRLHAGPDGGEAAVFAGVLAPSDEEAAAPEGFAEPESPEALETPMALEVSGPQVAVTGF
jgi:hypothetical protein